MKNLSFRLLAVICLSSLACYGCGAEGPAITSSLVEGDVVTDGGGSCAIPKPLGCACAFSGECEDECVGGVCLGSCSVHDQACIEKLEKLCPQGYELLSGADGAVTCQPAGAGSDLCKPCVGDGECQHRCLSYDDAGSFCGIACPFEGCPPGFICSGNGCGV